MAQFQNMIITRAGLDMIAQSQAGGTLIFTKGKLGDGQIGDQSIPDLTDLINAKMSVELSSVTAKTEGHVEVRFIVDNTDLDVGFFVREVGIFAKVNDEGVEKLYGYANAGNYTNYLADKTVPIDSIITKIDLVVGNASNVAFTTDKSIVYVTLEDMENALNAHDAGTDAHEPAFDAHNAADDAHKDFTGATAEAAGKRGMVPAPAAGDQDKFLTGGKTYVPVASQTEAEGMTDDKKPMTALKVKQLIDKLLGASNGIAGLDAAAKLISDLYDFATTTEAQGGTNTTKPINAAGVAAAISALAGGAVIVDELLAQNGYVKFSNGLILQWGIAETSGSSAQAQVAFNIQFSTKAFSVIVTGTEDNDSTALNGLASTESFEASNVTCASSSVDNKNTTFYWYAIGR